MKEMFLWKKIREFDFKFDLDFNREFFRSTRFLACTSLMIHEIPQQARQQLRPKPKSPGLVVEANLDFRDKNFFAQCSNISKQGV